MVVHVRFFASLREKMGRASETVETGHSPDVAEIWARVAHNAPMPVNTLVSVNHEYADFRRKLADGDEVAFFPAVTGG